MARRSNRPRCGRAGGRDRSDGRRVFTLAAGPVDISVECFGFEALTVRATVQPLARTTVTIELEPEARSQQGVASALYGASALGGVVNLVSRRPQAGRTEREVLVNRTSRGGTDTVLWLSGGPAAR